MPLLINYKCTSNLKRNTVILQQDNLSELIINQPIVHIEHGVGRYQGLTTIKTASIQSEYLIILYAEGDKLYVPVSYLHLISSYTEKWMEYAPLHKLGGDEWNKEKQKISKTIYDHAAILLDIYAKRESKKGFSFKKTKKNIKHFVMIVHLK